MLLEDVSSLFADLIRLIFNINKERARPVSTEIRIVVNIINEVEVSNDPYTKIKVSFIADNKPEFFNVNQTASKFNVTDFIMNVKIATARNNKRYFGLLNTSLIAFIF